MNQSLFYAFAFIMVLATSCSKEQTQKENTLNGNWNWNRTEGGLANHIEQTPANTGEIRELKITSGNRYFMYTNGVLTTEGTYTIENKTCIHDHKIKSMILFSGVNNYMIEVLENNQLVLSDEAYDGTFLIFERKNAGDN